MDSQAEQQAATDRAPAPDPWGDRRADHVPHAHHPHHHHHLHVSRGGVLAGTVAVFAVYEIGAVTVNALLEDDIMPSASTWLLRPVWPQALVKARHVAGAAAMWALLGTVAGGVVAVSARRR